MNIISNNLMETLIFSGINVLSCWVFLKSLYQVKDQLSSSILERKKAVRHDRGDHPETSGGEELEAIVKGFIYSFISHHLLFHCLRRTSTHWLHRSKTGLFEESLPKEHASIKLLDVSRSEQGTSHFERSGRWRSPAAPWDHTDQQMDRMYICNVDRTPLFTS